MRWSCASGSDAHGYRKHTAYRPETSAYLHDYGARLLSRLALSLAVVSETAPAGTIGSRAARLGFGARLALWDQSDPYLLPAYARAVEEARASWCVVNT